MVQCIAVATSHLSLSTCCLWYNVVSRQIEFEIVWLLCYISYAISHQLNWRTKLTIWFITMYWHVIFSKHTIGLLSIKRLSCASIEIPVIQIRRKRPSLLSLQWKSLSLYQERQSLYWIWALAQPQNFHKFTFCRLLSRSVWHIWPTEEKSNIIARWRTIGLSLLRMVNNISR